MLRIALIVLYVVSSLAELLGPFVFAIGFGSGDPKWFVGGIDIVIAALALNEGMKYYCRGSGDRFDAYMTALDEAPLPGRAWHLVRRLAYGYRLSEGR